MSIATALVLFLAAALACHEASAAPSSTERCTVGANSSLVGCLESAASVIVIPEDYSVGSSFEPYQQYGHQLLVRRNVTITGPGSTFAPDGWPVLDFNFVRSAVEVCGTCTLTMSHLVLRQERKGTGPNFDVFVGQPGSKVVSRRLYRLRQACTPPKMQLTAVQKLRRSTLLPGSTLPQQIALRNVTYKGKVYVDSVWSSDLSFDVPFEHEEGEGGNSKGGYAQANHDTVRLCEAYISKDCLASGKSGDACVVAALESMQAGAAGAAKQPSGMGAATAVAIVVPLVVGFLLAAGVLVWWLRRRGVRSPVGAASAAMHGHKLHPSKSRRTTLGTTPSRHTCSTGGTYDTESDGTAGSGGPCLGKPLATSADWEQIDSRTSPLLGTVEDSSVELGSLIGAGSFGKVFRGRWNGMTVAVKVIEHTGTSAAAVESEMGMMMSFHHTNIIRAFHFVTFVHKDAPVPESSEYSNSCTLSCHGSGALSSFSQHGLKTMSGSFTAAKLVTANSASFQSTGGAVTAAAAAAAAAAAGGAVPPAPLARLSGRGAAAGAAAGGCACCGTGDTVLTIAEGVAMQDTPEQPAAGSCAYSHAPPAAAGQPAHNMDTSSSTLPGGQPCGASSFASTGSFTVPAAGLSKQDSQQPCLTDSLGSSVDCKCVAGELRRTRSHKEPSKRFESWLVLEYADRGSLSQYLGQWPAPGASLCAATMIQLLQLLHDTAEGLQELHQHNVVHGDLNARNVLVASNSDAAGGVTAKLSDLGLSRSIKQHNTHRTTNTVGTMNHMPPEMLRSGQMSVAADVYALGIMMWEMYTGEDAFQGLQHVGQFFETVVLQDLRPVVPHGMPADYQLLMQHCWATDVSARPSIARVLECLAYMLYERQAADASVEGGGKRRTASAPLPLLLASPPPRKQHWWQQHHLHRLSLLKMLGSDHASSHPGTAPPSQASSGLLPCADVPGSAHNSNTLLPVLDLETPATTSRPNSGLLPAVPPSVLMQQTQQQQHAPAAANQRDLRPPGALSQPLPSAFAGSFSFFPQAAAAPPAANYSPRLSTDVPCASREGSRSSHKSGGSSGRLPTLLANIRQGSFSLHDMSFSSSRGPSWTARGASQTGSLGDAAAPWFV